MRNQPSGWRKLLRFLLPERGKTSTPPTIPTSTTPARVRSSVSRSSATYQYRAGTRPAATTRPANRSTASRSSNDPLIDPISPQHQAVYGGAFWGSTRTESPSTPDCDDRSSRHDSGSSWSSHDSGGSSSSYGGSSSYDSGSSSSSYSGGDSGGSW